MSTQISSDLPDAPVTEHAAGRAARQGRYATLFLAFSMFSTGASGLVSEYILATVSTYILGNSIEQFSVIIGLMMAMMGLGSWAQRFLSDRSLIEKFLGVEILLALLTSSAPISLYAAYAVMADHFPLIQYGFAVATGFLIGFEIPLILRINERFSGRLAANVASIFSAEYVGAFVGALVWAFVLLRFFPLTESGVLVAGVNFGVAVSTYLYFRAQRLTSRSAWPLAVACVVLGWMAVVFTNNRAWAASLEQRLYDDPIVMSRTTRYQHLVLTHDRAVGDYRLYINGNTQFSSLDEHIYHEQLVHPAMTLADRRERVLILGGGDGLALREVLKYPDVREALLVDLDPEVTEIAATHPAMVALNEGALSDARVTRGLPAGVGAGERRVVQVETGRFDARGRARTDSVAQVRVMNVDAYRFVEAVPGRHDVMIVDFPDPNAVELTKLYSREFYRILRARLAPGGMIAVQATSPYHAKEAYLCILRTLESAGYETLPYHDNVPSFGEWGWILAWNPASPPAELEERLQRVDRFPVETRYLTPDLFRAATVFGRDALATRESAVNTLLDPVLHSYYVHAGWQVD